MRTVIKQKTRLASSLALALSASATSLAAADDGDDDRDTQEKALTDVDRTGPQSIQFAMNRWFNASGSIFLNIDSDDDDADDQSLRIVKNTDTDTGGEVLVEVGEDGNVGIGVQPGSARLRVWNFEGNGMESISDARSLEAISTAGDIAVLASNQSATGIGVYGQNQPGGNYGYLGSDTYGVYGFASDQDTEWAGYFEGRGYFGSSTFVGRNTAVTSAEVFGIHSQTTTSYGGMYISTQGENARPFYGYAAGGDADMWHYYDGSTGKWHLYNNGTRMTVTEFGAVGIGTDSPTSRLQVMADSNSVALYAEEMGGSSSATAVLGYASATSGFARGITGLSEGSGGTGIWGRTTSSNGTTYAVRAYCASPNGYDFYAEGPGQNYGSSSSRRWKQHIENISNPLSKLAQLRGVYFDWDEEHGGHHDVGMIAEEVGAVLPEIVQYEENGIDAIGMDYSKLTPLLVEAVNALRAEKESQLAQRDSRIAQLEQENQILSDRMAAVEARFAAMAEDE